MSSRTPAARNARIILGLGALMLPALSLIPLGGLYLWTSGYLLAWSLAALVCVTGFAALSQYLLRPVKPLDQEQKEAPVEVSERKAGSSEMDREAHAWEAIQSIVGTIDADALDSTEAFADLAKRTIESVAIQMHPGVDDSVWNFTLPEALAISERVSRRLGKLVVTHIPFGDRLTLSQVRYGYEWRGAVEVAEKAYSIWRVLRFVNPATAVAHEARERLSRAAMNWGREQVVLRFATGFVEEIGGAAIDLYSGRLKVATAPDAERQPLQASNTAFQTLSVVVAGVEHERARIIQHKLQTVVASSQDARLGGLSIGDTGKPALKIVAAQDLASDDIRATVANGLVVLWMSGNNAAEKPADDDALRRLLELILSKQKFKHVVVIRLGNGDQRQTIVEQHTVPSVPPLELPEPVTVFLYPSTILIDENNSADAIVRLADAVDRVRDVLVILANARPHPPGKPQTDMMSAGRQAVSATGVLVKSMFVRSKKRGSER